jgi:hypothetical protein
MSDTFSGLDEGSSGLTVALWARRAVVVVSASSCSSRSSTASARSPLTARRARRRPQAAMTLTAPSTVREGVLFQSRFEIRATRPIDHPRIVLADGWVEGIQVNSIEPSPVGEASRGGRVVLSDDALKRGDRLRVWLQFQVNPTNVGHRSYGVELDDAERPVTRIARKITVLP